LGYSIDPLKVKKERFFIFFFSSFLQAHKCMRIFFDYAKSEEKPNFASSLIFYFTVSLKGNF